MKYIALCLPNLNNWKPTKLYYPKNEGETKLIINEVFINQIYNVFDEELGTHQEKSFPVILDIGAHIGTVSLYYASLFKNAIIYAVEANPLNYKALVKNTKDYKNIKTFNIAISKDNGQRTLLSHPENDTAETFYPQAEGKTKIKVNSVKIEKFLKDNKIKHIDLLKIDTEGCEYEIFMSNGFREISPMIDRIIGESHYIIGIPDMIYGILRRCNFETKIIDCKNTIYTCYIKYDEGIMRCAVKIPTMFYSKKI